MLVEKLLQEKKDVTVIVRKPEYLNDNVRTQVRVIQANIIDGEAIRKITNSYDCIVHCAAPTQSSYMIKNPVETAQSIVIGTQNMLELAVRSRVKSMVYLSSMEVYGEVASSSVEKVVENELGGLNISNIRSCYPMAKRMAENFCHLYHYEYDVPVKIARLAQTFGRGIREGDNRVFAQFVRAVRNNTDIVLHTQGNSVGNYCDIDDAINAIIFLLEQGESAQAYNIVNESNTMTISEMAKLVAEKIADGKIQVVYDIINDNRFGYAAETRVRLSGAKMKNLGWEAKTSLVQMYRNALDG